MNRLTLFALLGIPVLVAALPLASVFMFRDGGGSSGSVVVRIPAQDVTQNVSRDFDLNLGEDHVAYGLSESDTGCAGISTSPIEG